MEKGSGWNIWDLHVHTPMSIVNHYQGDTDSDKWDLFIQDLERLPEDVKVIGINDYLFLDGYERVMDYKKKGRLNNINLILPVVEFRLSQFGGHDDLKRINFHVIFSDKIDTKVIKAQFLSALSSKYHLSPEYSSMTWGGCIDKQNLYNLGLQIINSAPDDEKNKYGSPLIEGFNNLNLNYEDIMGILQGAPQFFKNKYLTAIGKTEWDSIRWSGCIATKKSIINRVDFIFTAAGSVENYNKGLESLTRAKVNNRLLDCSDAHYNSNSPYKDRIGNCHCWIKAETTFEGLKQVLFEPEERKMVSLIKPQMKNSYQIIDRIELDEDNFWKGTIPLNPNLNTIIGGRATGKSTLLKSIAAKQNVYHPKEDDDFVLPHLNSVKVIWADGKEHPENQIDFFQQSYMYNLTQDKTALNNVLYGIISSKDSQNLLKMYESENSKLNRELSNDILDLFQLETKLSSLLEYIRGIGNKEGIIEEVQNLKQKMAELSKNASLTDEELRLFHECTKKIDQNKQLIEAGRNDCELFSKAKGVSIIDPDYICLAGLDGLVFRENENDIMSEYKDFSQKSNNNWQKYIDKKLKETMFSVDSLKEETSRLEKDSIYCRGQQFYSDNREIGDLKTKIKEEEGKVAEIENLEKVKERISVKIKALFERIITKHLEYRDRAQIVARGLHFDKDGLEISVKLSLKKDELCGFLDSVMNIRSGERQEYLKSLKEDYENKTEETIRQFLYKALSDEIILKNYNEIQQVTTRFLSYNWFKIDYEILYQNDTFKEMSLGKQAFVVLKLLLDFSDKKNPILIDQPEDSLDNRAIYNDLVKYIKKKKKERQIILVTHNPNVVVSSDAENVIVSNQQGNDSQNSNGCRFQYLNGALETTRTKDGNCPFILDSQGIREHVCEILEGGEDAFLKREQKYGLNQIR